MSEKRYHSKESKNIEEDYMRSFEYYFQKSELI